MTTGDRTVSRLMPDEQNRLLLQAVPEPPIAHAYHHWDEQARTLTYTYNGRRILEIHIPGTDRVSVPSIKRVASESSPGFFA